MRKGLIVTVLLAAMLAGLMMLSVYLMEEQNQRQALYRQQCEQLEQRAAQLMEKEEELAALVQRYESGQTDAARELEALQKDLEALQTEKQELLAQVEQIKTDIEATRERLKNEDSDQYYYLEVYDALTEGLNKVKGYIAGN